MFTFVYIYIMYFHMFIYTYSQNYPFTKYSIQSPKADVETPGAYA